MDTAVFFKLSAPSGWVITAGDVTGLMLLLGEQSGFGLNFLSEDNALRFRGGKEIPFFTGGDRKNHTSSSSPMLWAS